MYKSTQASTKQNVNRLNAIIKQKERTYCTLH